MKILDNKGFAALHVVLLLVIAGIIAGTGYMVYKLQLETKNNLDNAANSGGDPQKIEKKAAEEVKPPQSDAKEYSNTELGFKFTYPKDWTVDVKSTGYCPALVSSFQPNGTSATKCPVQGSIWYGEPGDSTYLANVLVFTGATKTLDEVLAVEGGPNATRSETFKTTGGLNAFFYNQGLDKTSNNYSDNVYVVEYAPGSFLYLNSREYVPGGGVSGEKSKDLRQYQVQFDAIARSVSNN